MGEAKKRGTFDKRKEQAIERNIIRDEEQRVRREKIEKAKVENNRILMALLIGHGLNRFY